MRTGWCASSAPANAWRTNVALHETSVAAAPTKDAGHEGGREGGALPAVGAGAAALAAAA